MAGSRRPAPLRSIEPEARNHFTSWKLPPLFALPIVHRDVMRAALASRIGPHTKQDTIAFDLLAEFDCGIGVRHGVTVDFENHVSSFESRLLSRRTGFHIGHERALAGEIISPPHSRIDI